MVLAVFTVQLKYSETKKWEIRKGTQILMKILWNEIKQAIAACSMTNTVRNKQIDRGKEVDNLRSWRGDNRGRGNIPGSGANLSRKGIAVFPIHAEI